MKFSCQTVSLNKAVQIVLRAISSKPSSPIFSGIKLIAEDNTLKLRGMDLNMAIAYSMPCEVEEKGEMLVSAKHFSDLIRKLGGETVCISKNETENTINIQSAKSDFQLLLMNDEDYPQFPFISADRKIVLKDEKIRELIKKTIFACSTDEGRPLFTGILAEINDGKVTFVGTNTHRLAIKSIEESIEDNFSVIIPARALGEIVRNLSGELPQDVEISISNNQIMIVIEQIVIVSRLIEGKFPNYRRVVPPAFAVKLEVNVKELAAAVERIALFSGDNEYGIIKMHVENNELILTSSNPEVGKGTETVACEMQGEPLNVAFNSQYILDILKNIVDEKITMELNNSSSPVCIKPIEEQNYLYILTPIRVVF